MTSGRFTLFARSGAEGEHGRQGDAPPPPSSDWQQQQRANGASHASVKYGGTLRFGPVEAHEAPLPVLEGLGAAAAPAEAAAAPFNFVHSEGLAYEAREVNRCLREGLLEAPAFGATACLRVMQVIEDIRAHWQGADAAAAAAAGGTR